MGGDGEGAFMRKVLEPPVTSGLIDSVVKRITQGLDVERIILFGSHATGRPSKDSDLDLLVIARIKEKGVSRYVRVSRLLEPRKVPMDIIVKTPAEIKKRLRVFDPFIKNVLETGKVLYEKKA
jgi:predicted nucleotidyltransferase